MCTMKWKSCVGDPSCSMHFEKMPEMHVFRAFGVEKRATPCRGRSLFLRRNGRENHWKLVESGNCKVFGELEWKITVTAGNGRDV